MHVRILALIAAFGLAMPAIPVAAQEHQHRSTPESISRLDSADRAERLQVTRVVQTLGLKSGDRVADIGAGSGLFARPIARAVGPAGVVYAVDIDEGALQFIADSARKESLPQIRTVRAGESDPKIPEPVDLVVIIDTLHHVPDLAQYIKDLKRYLRPSGRIAIMDFTERWPKAFEHKRYSVANLDSWMAAAGLSRIAAHDFIENHFLAVYGAGR